MTNIPFICVRTEGGSELLDSEIEKYIDERNLGPNEKCKLLNRIDDVKIIFEETKILLAPSLVDETFGRTVNEAMMNGIPVITTGKGHLKNLVGDRGIIIDSNNQEKWEYEINRLYFNDAMYEVESKYNLEQYEKYSEHKNISMFNDIVTKIIIQSKEMNIMIFAPWCDQGLGIQSKNYYNILKQTQYNVHIFSYKPYNASSAIKLQKDPSNWIVDNIYYSGNDRESVTDNELITFILKYNIGKAIVPETCWSRTFEIAKLFKVYNVKCYGIPNIEIVEKKEIFKHKYFHKILCNNFLCQNIFNNHIIETRYIGYNINNKDIQFKQKNIQDKFKFLLVGGMNAFTRKQIIEVCEAFVIAYEDTKNILLTCTIQKVSGSMNDDELKISKYLNHPAINIIRDHQLYSDILNLYYDSHISVQVSKHEGLGIGFYESINTGTPVLTLDTAPHNEVILNNVNGWTIPCYYKKMTDNKDPIFDSAYFDPLVLAKKIIEISHSANYTNIIKSLRKDFADRFSHQAFKNVFISALNN